MGSISYKEYSYTNGYKAYYLTISGMQFGPIMFTLKEVMDAIERLKSETT